MLFPGDRFQRLRLWIWPGLALWLLLLGATPGLAHHAPLNSLLPDPWSGLASGLAHPFTDPRHLLFLLVLGLVGVRQGFAWMVTLLSHGLVGLMIGCSLLELPSLYPLLLITFLTLALVLIDWLPAWSLSPSLVLHGTALGHLQGGWSLPALLGYLLGIPLAAGLVLILAMGSWDWLLVRGWNRVVTVVSASLTLAGVLVLLAPAPHAPSRLQSLLISPPPRTTSPS
jgi:urease accessory protein